MKILITGNLGYVGPAVIDQLRASYPDATLIGLDIGYFAHCLTNTKHIPECKLNVQYFCDIRNFPKDILKDVDAIVHLAAISNDPIGNVNEEVTLDINYKASIELAKAAKNAGVKTFVYASSCSVYGFTEEGAVSENSSVNPLTAYAKSKVFTERELEKIAGKNFKVTSCRFATACGMSDRLRLDLVLNDFVASAVSTGKITILSDGTPWRPLVNIKDMALAIDWAINRKISNGGEYLIINIGSEEWNYKIKELADAVSRVIPNTDVVINKNASPDNRSYRVDFSLFKTLALDYKPKHSLISTVNELKEGLISIGFKDKDFCNSSFVRLKVLQGLKEKGLLSNDFKWTFSNIHKKAVTAS